MENDWALQMHGFFVNTQEKTMRFDVVLSFDIPQQKGLEILHGKLSAEFPEYEFNIVADLDITD